MNDKDDVTQQIIEAISYYETLLDKNSKQNLINFVLKTHLSVNAKLRLKSTCSSTILRTKQKRKKCALKKKCSFCFFGVHNLCTNTQKMEERKVPTK